MSAITHIQQNKMTTSIWPNSQDAIKFGKDFMVGGVSAVVAKTIIAPIERIKLILQLQTSQTTISPDKRYKGAIDILIRLPKEQGILSFWRGNGTNIIRGVGQESLGMGFKELFKSYCLSGVDRKNQYGRYLFGNLMAGGLSGCASFCFIYPLDFTKTRLTVDMGKDKASREFHGLIDCFYKIAKADGIIGLYRGFIPSLQFIFLYRAIYYGLFDTVKGGVEESGREIGFIGAFSIGQVTTFIAAMTTYPIDTVRRRLTMQAGKKDVIRLSTWQCTKLIYYNEGLKAFYHGAWVNALRGIGAALILALYHEVQKVM